MTYSHFGNLVVFTKLHMECKQIQVINPLREVHRVEEDKETLDDQYKEGSTQLSSICSFTAGYFVRLDCDYRKQVTTNGL